MTPMNLAEQFDALDGAQVAQMVAERRQEDLHLDFKLVSADGTLNRDQRKLLAQVVAGFGNADGGLAIWGVNARPDEEDEIDAAKDMLGVGNADRCLAELHKHTAAASNPIVQGVRHKQLIAPDGTPLCATLVPESDGGPHMAKLGEDRFYMRCGSAFLRMEHFQIADMFGRRRRPVLTVVAEPFVSSKSDGPSGPQTQVAVKIGLRNAGRAIARFPILSLRLTPNDPFSIGRPKTLPERPIVGRDRFKTYAGGVDQVVHAGTLLWVIESKPTDVGGKAPPPPDLVIEYVIAAEDFPPIEDQMIVPSARIAELHKPPS